MKRPREEDREPSPLTQQADNKRIKSDHDTEADFREHLFDAAVQSQYAEEYRTSQPYKHGVISNLINPALLRSVRSEIQTSLSFTPKETDIYKIHQSGDLANLDGLDDSSLAQLPSLLRLRNALYSPSFREYLASVTGSGPLSGRKTDMAINVYTPGCHLICHDDVIGSRRVSYILYLTDPGKPWQAKWGGALRLYPTNIVKGIDDGQELKTPSSDFSVSIPPAFNQLSFFAVQPGESFHDVEEVYARDQNEPGEDVDGGRIRMAISGWYHIPQDGEEGYEDGLEERLAEKSSLVQLQGKADELDFPKSQPRNYADQDPANKASSKTDKGVTEEEELSEQDLDFLIKYIAPTYLTPDTLEELSELFADESCLRLETFLCSKFAEKIRKYIEAEASKTLPGSGAEIEKETSWRVARPPHKHRFLYQQPRDEGTAEQDARTPLQELLEDLLPSQPFRKWLSIATSLGIESCNILGRRFRKGSDYTLATGMEVDGGRLEVTLGVTPTTGWGDDDDQLEDRERKTEVEKPNGITGDAVEGGVGGYEVYMAGDDDEEEEADAAEDDPPASAGGSGAAKTSPKKAKADPAIYKSSSATGDGEDDGVLFSMPAGWNRLSIVLRDRGVLKFVKYVSRSAPGDRWDVVGEFGLKDEEEDDDIDEGSEVEEVGEEEEADQGDEDEE
ncbi:MAG: hypothetical protein M1817_000728 [Caeruleum heppii]|nr:MAG: hypothetical protein M1817_000728 [Caeruleum heppii]